MSKEAGQQEEAGSSGIMAHVGMKVPPLPPNPLSVYFFELKLSEWPSWCGNFHCSML